MKRNKIWPMNLGLSFDVDKGKVVYGIQGETITTATIAYLVRTGRENILVDTGAGDPKWALKYHKSKRENLEKYQITFALRRLGLSPLDIDVVINTHLHWDHCSNNHLFKNADIFVQDEELRFAICPLPICALGYESQIVGMTPPWLKALKQIKTVKGDKDIIHGISLIHLPGHTPGLQGVCVETRKGIYVIASDLCMLFENWEGNSISRHIPSSIFVNLEDHYKSFEKVEKIAAFVLPGHDPKVFQNKFYPL